MRTFFSFAALAFLTCALHAADVKILVAYHSETGNTEQMAQALAAGAREAEGVEVSLKPIAEVSKADLEAADGIALGSPVHMGDVAWPVRQAFVRWSGEFGLWQSRGLQDKVAAVFATGGLPSNGKEFTLWSLSQSMLQFGMVLVTPYGSMGASATTERPDPGVDDAEKTVAADLGRRLAEVAARMKRGAAALREPAAP